MTRKLPAPRVALFEAECAYLRASGWTRVGDDAWLSPNPKYPGREYNHGHAVNSQKWHEDHAAARGSSAVYEKPLPPSRPPRRLKPWVHPICGAMADYTEVLPPHSKPEERLRHHEMSIRHHWAHRNIPGARQSLQLHIRSIRKGWKPFGGRIIRT